MRILLTAILLLAAASASAYELWLDIDVDGDPTTINDLTYDTACTVNLVLAPTEPSEEIWEIGFGLGGSCRECLGVHYYGTGFDLASGGSDTWTPVPMEFAGHVAWPTHLGCFDDPGFHPWFTTELLIDCCFVLEEPIVLATFEAWAEDNAGACNVPSNLAVMHSQGYDGMWNYVQIGGPALESDEVSWGTLKARYR